MIQAILFDFNGVIINDESLQCTVYQEVLARHDVSLTETQYFESLGMDHVSFVETAFARAGKELTNEIMSSVTTAKTEMHQKLMSDDLPLFPGVETFLKAAARCYSLGLVSMAGREEIRFVFSRTHLKPLFSIIVSAEDVQVCKPAPDCYRLALERLNEKRRQGRLLPLLPEECLVVEDSPPGIQSGRAAGMRTLGVTNTVSEAELRAAGADVVTASLADWNVDAVRHVFN
jgi:beta-phosphoglucomutase